MIPSLDYSIIPLARTKVRRLKEESTSMAGANLTRDVQVQVKGKWLGTTDRFWSSVFARFGFSSSIFRYFKHQEVFDRICAAHPDTELRFCADVEGKKLLAVSNPNKPVVTPAQYAEIAEAAAKAGSGRDGKAPPMAYSDGIASSTHTPASGKKRHEIGGDGFFNQFMLDIPLDGYGDPSIHLALLREICSNGAVARTPVFRSDLKIGDDPVYSVQRALSTFDNDDGFNALHQRFQSAQRSPASLRECLNLFKRMKTMESPEFIKTYEGVVGDIYDLYGVANLDGISDKKLRLLPAKCRVYDLINLVSEIATHHADSGQAYRLNGWIGTTICDEYDLEGTATQSGDFQDLFVPKKPNFKKN